MNENDTPTNESISSTTESWSDDIELILSNVLSNCNLLLIEHKNLYFYNKELFKYFKIPLIVLASLNSVFSVGLNSFINQNIVPIKINQIANEYYLINCISHKDYKWKRQYDKLKKHLSFCECVLCFDKRKIKNEIFYIIAESLFIQ